MSSTGIDQARVQAFVSKGEGVRGHMESTLKATQASVDAAISPAVWGGQASAAFGDVTTRYQTASIKLNRAMQDILDSVKTGANKLQGSDEANSQAVKTAASGNVHL
ncbi:WXG100 family type VII secretion target [Williamsia sp.]|uniref:WXG100 family type VII secretion target n=1 Tax=Williamsia sp. TaxID=1872085 RepID=UPI001A2C3251|nr:WXG100 family type VII secretion target [Williamsia sp.]MBJ7290823.1 WXG100 family type VII secretion target [Williamsia sp.]